MIRGVIHDVAKEPSTRAFLEVCIVQRAIRRIAIGSSGNRIDDVRGRHIRRVLTVGHARSSEVVLGIRADAHRRELVLPVDHFV